MIGSNCTELRLVWNDKNKNKQLYEESKEKPISADMKNGKPSGTCYAQTNKRHTNNFDVPKLEAKKFPGHKVKEAPTSDTALNEDI